MFCSLFLFLNFLTGKEGEGSKKWICLSEEKWKKKDAMFFFLFLPLGEVLRDVGREIDKALV